MKKWLKINVCKDMQGYEKQVFNLTAKPSYFAKNAHFKPPARD